MSAPDSHLGVERTNDADAVNYADRHPAHKATAISADWRSAYEPGLSWALRRPCGAWFRACVSVSSPRQRPLTSASCVAQRSCSGEAPRDSAPDSADSP